MPWSAGLRPSAPGVNTDSVFREPALMIEQERNEQEDPDLDQAEGHADARRDRDAAVDEPPDDQPAQHREWEPQEIVRESGQRRDQGRPEQPEGREQRGRNDRLGKQERPGHQPAGERAEAARDVGVHAARRGQVAGELTDRVGREHGRDEREDDRQGRIAGGEQRGGPDREGRGDRRRHVGDGLEQDLGEPDRPTFQGLTARVGRGRGHRASLSTGVRRAVLPSAHRARVACILRRAQVARVPNPPHGSPESDDVATLDRDGSARHRAARVACRTCRGRRGARAARVGLGRRSAPPGDRRPRGGWRPRDPGEALPAAAGAARGPGPHRLDQPAGTQLHLAATRGAARGGLWRRHVLRAVLDQAAAAGRGPCLRRHRLPDRRGGADLRGPWAGGRAGRRGRARWPGRLDAIAVPRPVRPGSGRDDHDRRRPGDGDDGGARGRGRDPQSP